MKTKILSALLLSIITYTANAQFPPFYFGLKAAPQVCWMKPNVDNYENGGAKAGFGWGFIAEFNFIENHSIGTGFNMLFNGGKLKFPAVLNGDTGTMNRNYSMKYIEVPFTLKMRSNAIGGIRYFGRIGLGTAFRIDSKKTDDFIGSDGLTISSKKSTYDNMAFARESLIVGLGAEYEVKQGPKLGVELTFDNGFTNILNTKNTLDPSIQEKAVPNFFELAFSVLF
ncbi:MAG: porin family protein [Bacteroidota bacterium]